MVAVDLVGSEVLLLNVEVKAAQLLPLDHRERRVEGVHLDGLDVVVVDVIGLRLAEVDALAVEDVAPVARRARTDADRAGQRVVALHESDADLDEGDVELVEPVYKEPLGRTSFEAKEDKVEGAQLLDGCCVDRVGVRVDAALDVRVSRGVVVDLLRSGVQVFEGGRSRRPEGVVADEVISVIDVDLRDRRLSNKVEDVGPGAAQADDGEAMTAQLV